MSIVRSTKSVSLTSNRTSRSIPIDHNYNRVCQYNLVPSEKDISAIFKASRDYYYRKALESVGNGSSRSDYKHYRQDRSSHPSCNCILCWTYRRSLKPIDYPTVRAKLLCMADQMRKEYVSEQMFFDEFEKLTLSYRFVGINAEMTREMNEALWEILFPGVRLNTTSELNDSIGGIVNSNLEIEYTVDEPARTYKRTYKTRDGKVRTYVRTHPPWTRTLFASPASPTPQYIESVRAFQAVCNGDNFTPTLEERISHLQERADNEFKISKSRAELRGLTPEQVENRHQKMLRPIKKEWFNEFDKVGMIVKHMFLHDYIMNNVYAASGGNIPKKITENKRYELFDGIQSNERKYKIFSSRISRANALIKAALRGFYFHDQKLIHQLETQYYAFTAEFVVFLKEKERKELTSIVQVKNIKNLPTSSLSKKMLNYFKKCETEYMIQKVEMELEKHKTGDELRKSVLWYIPVFRKALRVIRLEKSILAWRFGLGAPSTGMDCKEAVREYIDTLWEKLRSPESFPGYTPENIAKLMWLKRGRYLDKFITYNMQYLYTSLPKDLKEKVDKLWVREKLRLVAKFLNDNGIRTQVTEDSALQAYRQSGRDLDVSFSEPGGFKENFLLNKYIEEIFKMSAYAETTLPKLKNDINVLGSELERLIEMDEFLKKPDKALKYRVFKRWNASIPKNKRSLNATMQHLRKRKEQLRKMRANPNGNEKEINDKSSTLSKWTKEKAELEKMSHYNKRWQLYWWYHGERKRAKKLWKLSLGFLSDSEQRKSIAVHNQFRRNAEEIIRKKTKQTIYIRGEKYIINQFANEAIAEFELHCDIFGGFYFTNPERHSEQLDNFILASLPPKESLAFKMIKDKFSEPELDPSEMAQARMRFQEMREPFKEVVFEKELVKRAVIRKLRYQWNDRSSDEHNTWIGYKYRHSYAWLANNQKVFVYIDFNKYFGNFKGNKRKRSGEADDADLSKLAPGTRELLKLAGAAVEEQKKDNNWYSGREKTKIAMGWIQKIENKMVTVGLQRTISVSNSSLGASQTISEVNVDIGNVYENNRDYKAMVRYREDHRKRIQQEKFERDKLLKLREARKEFVFNIVYADLVEQRKIEEARELEDKTAIMVYDPNKKKERMELFKDWTNQVIKARATSDKYEKVLKIKKKLQREVKKEPFRYLMFEDGRKRWEEANNIGNTRERMLEPEHLHLNEGKDDLRGEKEQRMFSAAVEITKWLNTTQVQKESNESTRIWRRFIEWYGRNSFRPQVGGRESGLEDMPTLVRMDLVDLLKPFDDGPDRKEFLEKFKEKWNKATVRAIKRRKKAYEEFMKTNSGIPPLKNRLTDREKQLCDKVLDIVQEFIDNPPETDDRIFGKSPEVKKYIQTELGAQVERILKTPLQKYTLAMWKNEVEHSVARLSQPVWEELVKFVTDTGEYTYRVGIEIIRPQLTEYYRTFLFQGKNKAPVFPDPPNKKLKKQLVLFKPGRSPVRIAFGPGSWFKLDESSDMMRVTGLTMEERLLFDYEIKQGRQEMKRNTERQDLIRLQQDKAAAERKSTLLYKIDELKEDLKIPNSIREKVVLLSKLKSLTGALNTVYDFRPPKTEMEMRKDINNYDIEWKERKHMIESIMNIHSNKKKIIQAKADIEVFKQYLRELDMNANLKAKNDIEEFKLTELMDESTINDILVGKLGMLESTLTTLSSGLGNEKWKESDGNGTLHIIDDCVGEFKYVNERLIRNGTDVPTHLRLNRVYYDTKAGRVSDNAVRKLVPFYIVSLYMETEEGYERLPVRNRSDPTFEPRQDKFSSVKTQLLNRQKIKKMQKKLEEIESIRTSMTPAQYKERIASLEKKIQEKKTKIVRPFETSDYKGYSFSLCLSEKEFKDLTKGKQLDAGSSRMLTTLSNPFLHKYHAELYKIEKKKLGDVLIQRKEQNIPFDLPFEKPEMKIDGDDDPSLPQIDGLIHLKNDSLVDVFHNGFSIGDTCFDIDGKVIPCQKKLGLYYESGSMFYAVRDNIEKLRYLNISAVAIRSNTLFACIIITQGGLELWQCEFVGDKFENGYIAKVPPGTMLNKKWFGDMLLVVANNEVWGFDKNKAYKRTLRLEGHSKPITSLAICLDKIATASEDKTIMLWNKEMPELGEGVKVLVKVKRSYRFGKTKQHKEGKIYEVDVNVPNSKAGITGIYKCKPSAHLKTLRGHKDQIRSVVWCEHLISSSLDKTVCIWRTEETKKKHIGELLFKLDFNLLGLPQRVNYTLDQHDEYSYIKNIPHLRSVDKSVDIAVVGGVVVYHYAKVVGKLDPKQGKIIKFSNFNPEDLELETRFREREALERGLMGKEDILDSEKIKELERKRGTMDIEDDDLIVDGRLTTWDEEIERLDREYSQKNRRRMERKKRFMEKEKRRRATRKGITVEEYKAQKRAKEKRWQGDREKKWQAEKQKREQKELEDKANYWGMSVYEYLEKQKREQKELEEYLEKEKREQKELEEYESEDDSDDGRGGGESKN